MNIDEKSEPEPRDADERIDRIEKKLADDEEQLKHLEEKLREGEKKLRRDIFNPKA